MPSSWFINPANLVASSPYLTDDPDKGPRRFVQVFQSVPALEPLYLQAEKDFNVRYFFRWVRDSKWVPILAVILYLSFLIEGKRFMDRRIKAGKGPVRLGYLPAAWNLLLAVFSTWGALRVVPHFLLMFTHYDFRGTICAGPEEAGYGSGAAGLWVWAFTVSKVAELLDTVILVLKGKEPIFLHWYHHVTVLLYTWFSYSERNPGLYFIAMNYTVHAFMYSYYFLMEVKLWPKWLNPMFITLMQISQMFVGVGITVANYIYQNTEGCEIQSHLTPWCAAMYATYLYFFVEFFVQRFIFGTASAAAAGKGKRPATEAAAAPLPAAGTKGAAAGGKPKVL